MPWFSPAARTSTICPNQVYICDIISLYHFQGLDFVPTDLASGLILVQYEQTTEPRSLIHEPLHAISYTEQPQPSNGHVAAANSDITTETSGDRFPNPKPWMTVHEAAWYMRYALASYTWPLYIFMNPMTGCCKLMGGCRLVCGGNVDSTHNWTGLIWHIPWWP